MTQQHKARLAALHCGCFYWHVRRYSREAFYEPISVYLVTLTLWAYSLYTSQASPTHDQAGNSSDNAGPPLPTQAGPTGQLSTPVEDPRCIIYAEDDDDREPTFIRLDRPADDELVVLFVKKGRPATMAAHIAGVGNIYASQGPARILREGRKIVEQVSIAWGRTSRQVSILEAMDGATRSRP